MRDDARPVRALACSDRREDLARGPLAGRRSCAIWGAGKTGKALARALAAEGVSVEWWIDVAPRKVGGTAQGAPVHGPEDLPRPGGPLLLVAVAARGARVEIREHLEGAGWREGRDYLVCW